MESHDLSPSDVDTSRPSLGFPLGTALLLIIIFSLSGIFSCCYHWDKLRSLRHSFSSDPHSQSHRDHMIHINASLPSKSMSDHSKLKRSKWQGLPVLMPGDHIPKFIAMPCPCEASRPEKMMVRGDSPTQSPPFPGP